jgi:hypothetical protein
MPGGVTAAERGAGVSARARRVVEGLGGRYSTEAGIDVDAGDAEVERWFLASTLFGTRISAAIAQRAYRALERSGIGRIGQVRDVAWTTSWPCSTRAATPATTSAPPPACTTCARRSVSATAVRWPPSAAGTPPTGGRPLLLDALTGQATQA